MLKIVGEDNREEVVKWVKKMVVYTIKNHKGFIEYAFNKKEDSDEEYAFLKNGILKKIFG